MELQDNLQPKLIPDQDLKRMDQLRQVLRYYHYSYRTEQAYCGWIARSIKYHGGHTHPGRIGKQELAHVLIDQLPKVKSKDAPVFPELHSHTDRTLKSLYASELRTCLTVSESDS